MEQGDGLSRSAESSGDTREKPDEVGCGLGDVRVVVDVAVRRIDGLVGGLVEAHLQVANTAVGGHDLGADGQDIGPVHCTVH